LIGNSHQTWSNEMHKVLSRREGVRNLDENKKKLYVGNLSYDTTVDSLKAAFASFGDIVDAVIITDKYSGRSKGFGFVEFADEKMAQAALEAMNGKDMDGRALVVNVARPSKPRE
jgi:cold-inducible RNA-binding protein